MEQKNETEAVQNQRITDGVIWKQLILFSIPIMIGTLFQQLYNMIDAIVVGNFVWKTALASVGGSTQQIVGLVLGFFIELSSGAAVVIAQYYGAGEKKKLSDALHTTIAFCVISMGMSIFFLLCGKGLFGSFTADKNVIGIGVRILKYMAPAYALFVFIEIYSGALRGIGDVIIPTIMTCFGVCIFRIVWIFVIVPMNPTIEAVTLSHPVSWGVTALLYIIYWNLRKRRLLKG